MNKRHYNENHRRDHNYYKNYDNDSKSDNKKYSKGMILLKSSVFAMFIVLVVMIAAYEIVKSNKENFSSSNSPSNICNKNAKIKINQGVESIKENEGIITIITKISDNKQEVIRLDANCAVELSRLTITN